MSFVHSSLDHDSRSTKYATVSAYENTQQSLAREPSERVLWGINWKAPTKMVGLLVIGAGAALGHHFYYQSLDGKYVTADESKWDFKSQQWQLRYGTAFAFLAKTCLAASISVAYQQHIWTTLKRTPLSVSGINATFGAINDPFSFLNASFLSSVKIGFVLAALTWLMPLSALVTPATLTVVPSTTSTPQIMNVPMVDYTNISSLYNIDENIQNSDMNTVDNGVSPFLSRIMAATATSIEILPMVAIAPAANYSVQFSAPSFHCVTASANITTVIDKVLNCSTQYTKGGGFSLSFLAFTPEVNMMVDSGNNYYTYQKFFDTCIGGTPSMNDSGAFYCDGMSYFMGYNGTAGPGGAYIWVLSDGDYYSCSLEDTRFNVTFNATETLQTINIPYSFNYTGATLKDGHFVHGQVMSNWVSGVLFGWDSGVTSFRTQIIRSSLYASLKTNGKPQSGTDGIAETGIPASEKALANGLNMGQLIEELSRNLTLSLFSADVTWSPQGINTTVNIIANVNIYTYNVANLAMAYGIAIAVTVISVMIGMRALMVNGVSHGTSFSAIMCSTRNETLDNLTVGSSLAAEPLSEGVLATELKFGLLNGRGDAHGLIRRVGFGVAGEVDTLRKGAGCY
ncbi:uncharacterized protein PAC_01025 [Phialocephala subalpina]|uniref:Uncharacterized protein n=1 Tax=Phialocephala subalpina TaxID=576137 RepID=A0A1L7WED0_9HELO|nr:uncharacterized protein PAC_01025 [Phialocephala subalpina]